MAATASSSAGACVMPIVRATCAHRSAMPRLRCQDVRIYRPATRTTRRFRVWWWWRRRADCRILPLPGNEACFGTGAACAASYCRTGRNVRNNAFPGRDKNNEQQSVEARVLRHRYRDDLRVRHIREGRREEIRSGCERDRNQDRPDRAAQWPGLALRRARDRKSTRLNSSHMSISYAVFCLKKKKKNKKLILVVKKKKKYKKK